MGDLSYVVPPLPGDTEIYLCVDLVITMGWVNFTPSFCVMSETEADLANIYISEPSMYFTKYRPTSGSYSNFPSRMAYPARLQGTYVYMDNLMCVVQGDPTQQHRVTEMVLRPLKEVLTIVSVELKDSVSLNKSLQGDGNW